MANKYNKNKFKDSKSTPKDPMVDYVVKEFMKYESFHRDRFDKDKEIYDHWHNVPPNRDFTWQNAVHVPVTVEAEQTITPRIYSSLFPTQAPIDVVAENNASPQQGIKIRDYIRNNFRLANVQSKSLTAITQCSLFGTGYVYAPWLIDRRWVISGEKERLRGIVNQYTDCETVNYFEMYPHPAKLQVWDELPLIRRRFADAEYIKTLAEDPRFNITNATLGKALDSETLEVDQRLQDQANANPLLNKRDNYEILEYWGPWDMSYEKDNKTVTQKAVPHWIIVINRSIKLQGIPNPYDHQRPPFCKLKFFEEPQPSWFGVGIGTIGKSTQERLNKLVNQRLDNVDLVLNRMGVYNAHDTMINKKRLRKSMPGLWHGASDINNIKWMDMPDVTNSSYKEEEMAKNDFRESTGATMHLMPSQDPQHRTATGLNMLQGAAGMRFRTVLKRLEIDFVQDLAQMMLANAQQFMSFPQEIILEDENGAKSTIQVSPEDIIGNVYFIPTGVSETMSKDIQVAQLLRFKEVTIQDPTINRAEINKRVAELMGLKNIDKLIVPRQQVNPQSTLDDDTQQRALQMQAEGFSAGEIERAVLGPPEYEEAGSERA